VTSELSSASGSGVVTEDGASYVPQVAIDLQTAPVVPPGAFPHGGGGEGKYVAEICGWSVKLSLAESAATIAEYAAKQEAELGDDPAWGGRYTAKQALKIADALEEEANNIEKALEDGVGGLVGYGGQDSSDSPVAKFIEAGVDLDRQAADKLRECAGKVKKPVHSKYLGQSVQLYGVCSFEWEERAWLGFQILTLIRIEPCWQTAYEVSIYENSWAAYECSSGRYLPPSVGKRFKIQKVYKGH